MNKLWILTKGELSRLNKYRVTTVSLAVAIMWLVLLLFIEDEGILTQLLPFILMVDATIMSVMFIGSVMFFEKTEQTISTLLVTPTTYHEQILSKAIANTVHMFFSSLLIILVFYFVRGIEVNFVYIIIGLLVSIFSHSLLGFVFSYHAKDFTSLLMIIMVYGMVVTIPVALFQFGILLKGTFWRYVLLLSPTQASTYLIEAGLSNDIQLETVLSLIILVMLSVLGYAFYIYPKYKHYAVKQSGV